MLSQLTRCAKYLWARLSAAASQLFCRLTQPARPNLVTSTLADLPRKRAELLAENALLRQQLIVLHRPLPRENAAADVAGAMIAVAPRALGSQLETCPADYPAGYAAPVAPTGFSVVLEAEVTGARADPAPALGT